MTITAEDLTTLLNRLQSGHKDALMHKFDAERNNATGAPDYSTPIADDNSWYAEEVEAELLRNSQAGLAGLIKEFSAQNETDNPPQPLEKSQSAKLANELAYLLEESYGVEICTPDFATALFNAKEQGHFETSSLRFSEMVR